MRWERSGFLNGRQLYCLRSDINGSRWRMFEEASFSSLRNAYILQWTNLRGQLKLFLRWRKKPCRLWIFLKQFRRQCPDDEKDRLTSSLCQLFTEKYWGKISDLQCDSVLKRLNNTFESIHFESNEWLSLMQFTLAVVAGGVTLTGITKNYSLVNFFYERLLES